MKSLTYIEIDLKRCDLNWGEAPCRASDADRTDGDAVQHYFENDNNGWTANDGTLTPGPDGSLLVSSGDNMLLRTGLNIDGGDYRYVYIDFTCTQQSTNWQGTLYYVNSGHGHSSSFRKDFGISNPVLGQRVRLLLDMSMLTAGGDDWIENDQTGLRFDLSNNATGQYLIHEISVGRFKAGATKKCFNTIKTCQDPLNFDEINQTVRFGRASLHYPPDIDHIPNLVGVNFTGAVISLGENLGQRATLTVSFGDHPHSDVGFDKYLNDRDYDPFKQGSFWGKFRARQPYLQGRPLRLIRGFLGQSLGQMEVRHYVIESFSGPSPDGIYTIEAKDVLKLADGDRAQAPLLSNGFLLNDVNVSETMAQLNPAGIGDLEYPASGHVAIGGREICSFTRSGDVLTLTRGQLNTTETDLKAQDRVQVVLEYVGEDPADIINHLITTYTTIDPSFIPLSAWQLETATYLQRLYTAYIAEPTPVRQLISELIEQAALALWWDDIQQRIGLQVLRGVSTSAQALTPDIYVEESLNYREQPEKRISQVWTYYGLRNPLRPISDHDNYVSSALTVDLEAETNYGAAAIKKIFSRWIPAGGRSVALRVNDIQLGRYTDPPRRVNFSLFRDTVSVLLAGGYILEGQAFQDDEGVKAQMAIQVTSLNDLEEGLVVEAQEVLFKNFDPTDLSNRSIIIEVPTRNVNARALHDQLFPAPTEDDVGEVSITIIISANVIVGSNSSTDFALRTGSWPAGMDIKIINYGVISGKGGDGGNYGPGQVGTPGEDGGPGLLVEVPVVVDNQGTIQGGGGGAGAGQGSSNFVVAFRGGGPGGGGAGDELGDAGVHTGFNMVSPAQPGTISTGGTGAAPSGSGGPGGDGGGPGQAGQAGGAAVGSPIGTTPQAGGAAGVAIDGNSLITYDNVGTIHGAQIN